MGQNITHWNGLMQHIPEGYIPWLSQERDFLEKYIARNSKVLEIGCGAGRSLEDLANITPNLTGIDYDPQAIELAREKLKDKPSIRLAVADGINLPLESETFDYALCLTTVANFGDKKYKVFEEMKRVLTPEGKILISCFGEDALQTRLKIYVGIGNLSIKEVKPNGTVVFNGKEDFTSEQFSKQDLYKLASDTNLKIIEIKPAGIGYYVAFSKK